MTVASTTNRKTYTGDNVSTSFATSPVIFYLTSNLQVRVTVIATGVSTLLTENTHYTVSGGAATGATGTVNLAGGSSPHGALLSTEKLVILRVLPLTQASDFVNNSNSDAEVLEAALDKLTDVDQQIQEQADRSIRFASGDVSGSVTEIPDVTTRAGQLLGFDMLGVLTTFVLQVGTSLVDLAAAAGSSLIGFIQTGTGAVRRTVQAELRDVIKPKQFGAIGDGVANDTAALTAWVAALNAATTSFTPTNGATIAYGPAGYLPPGRYKITSAIPYFGFTKIYGHGQAIIEQVTAGATHFTCASVYDNEFSGIKFVGGKRAIYAENPNTDYTTFRVTGCEFQALTEFAIYTFGTGDIQISGDLTISECRFLNCAQTLRNAFDNAVVQNTWDEVTNTTTMQANTARYVVARGLLQHVEMFGVPFVGDVGAGRAATIRWVDILSTGQGLISYRTRYGGESAGMPIVYNFAGPQNVAPYVNGCSISMRDCQIACGPAAAADSSVINCQTEVPQLIDIQGCYGASTNPIIFNGAALVLATYFAAQNTAAIFRFRIHPNMFAPAALNAGFQPYVAGEVVSSSVASGAAVSLTTSTVANVTSLALPAGDWDVSGIVDYTFGATTNFTTLLEGIATTSATLGATDTWNRFTTPGEVPGAGQDPAFPTPVLRFRFAVPTTVYLLAFGIFTVSTLKAYGTLQARRID